jgi:hypothetical protein
MKNLAQLANADAALVRRGRHLNTRFLVEIGDDGYLVSICEGKVQSVTPGPFVMQDWDFALRASSDTWEKFWLATPPPGYHDLFALMRYRRLRVEGSMLIFMRNLLYIKGLMASLRPSGAAQ